MKKTFHEICADAKINIKEYSVEDVLQMLKNKEDFVLVDTREDNEFNHSHIKGSIHIGRGILERDIHLHIPDHNKKIVLYCGGGYRSALAAESLQKMGYENVISMDGGWKGWNKAGGEIEK
ncbi:MAG: sulfurtransferase [Ignavibacteria bacterium]|nr:sulfurtransferase [Ignavibacteria bacterium]